MSLLRRISAFLSALCLLLSLSACSRKVEEETVSQEDLSSEIEDVVDGNGLYVTTFGDQKFTLSYDSADTLDPFTCKTTTNEVVIGLMYEGLFRTDSSFHTQKVLCEGYTVSDDMTQYTFSLIEGVTFHDGSSMTAADVKYSIERAMVMPKYSYRLAGITSVEAAGDRSVAIVLSSPDGTLPALLDIPIIKIASGDQASPPGTGPYHTGANQTLTKYTGYRSDLSALPDTVYLAQEQEQSQQMADFSSGALDLLLFDRTSGVEPTIHISCEKRSFTSTVFQFLGFNTEEGPFTHAALRAAVYAMVDESYLSDTVMSGCVSQAHGFLPAEVGYCRDTWDTTVQSDLQSMSAKLNSLNMADTDLDGYLDFPEEACSIRFIVSDSNHNILAAAKRINAWLTDNGLKSELAVLSAEEYARALEEGNYDIYYGQVRLAPNFSLAPLIGTGGSLNLSGYSSEALDTLCTRFLTADSNTKADAAEALLNQLMQEAPIVPIAYNRYLVFTHSGDIQNLEPGISGIFQNLPGLSITPR